MSQKVLSYDLGGTKVAVGVINSRGRILDEIRVPVVIQEGKEAVLNQLVELGNQLLKKHKDVRKIGIASAGPLNPIKGELLDPTNFKTEKESWGRVPIAQILKQRLKRSVYLENDAAAAVLAEHWIGAGKNTQNVMVLTLGTGLGTGIICNGKLVRAGRNLHPEAGHMIVNYDDPQAICGCGNQGCAEYYLSGVNFGRRAGERLGQSGLTAKEIADLARQGNVIALALFDEYSKIMAATIQNYVRLYAPEVIVLTGSFAFAADLFLVKTQTHLEKYLERQRVGIDMMPKLTLSTLHNEAGLIGGAYVAFHAEGKHIKKPKKQIRKKKSVKKSRPKRK